MFFLRKNTKQTLRTLTSGFFCQMNLGKKRKLQHLGIEQSSTSLRLEHYELSYRPGLTTNSCFASLLTQNQSLLGVDTAFVEEHLKNFVTSSDNTSSMETRAHSFRRPAGSTVARPSM